ncbi:MAG: DUF2309 domain-containing protein [Hydrogenibacillus schlegelii]|uniref:Probable inorganic carbon transporter subunit DabA n=1 Tax=Hydrogenibacillus schlegelii TaxID=1484 RepID=A0A947CYY8_HYDSH|nr:DUF2309 domain-containing protein [Hydrogenibacillus schlegelii]
MSDKRSATPTEEAIGRVGAPDSVGAFETVEALKDRTVSAKASVAEAGDRGAAWAGERAGAAAPRGIASEEAEALAALVREAAAWIAPLWPLATWAPRQPLGGLEGRPFAEVVAEAFERYGVDLLPPEAVLRAAWAAGEVAPEALWAAYSRYAAWERSRGTPPVALQGLWASLPWSAGAAPEAAPAVRPAADAEGDGAAMGAGTAVEAIRPEVGAGAASSGWARSGDGRKQGLKRRRERPEERLERLVIRWAKAVLGADGALLPLPVREDFYRTVRALAAVDPDLSPEARRSIAVWPETAPSALAYGLRRLGLWPDRSEAARAVLIRHLLRLPGWAGMFAWRERHGEAGALLHYLAARLLIADAVGAASFFVAPDGGVQKEARLSPRARFFAYGRRLVWLSAWEETLTERIAGRLTVTGAGRDRRMPRGDGAEVQLFFCLDARSEPLRRALEKAGDGRIETVGVAGFFHLPLWVVTPEGPNGYLAAPPGVAPIGILRVEDDGPAAARRALHRAEEAMKGDPLAGFAAPELTGLAYALEAARRSVGPVIRAWSARRREFGKEGSSVAGGEGAAAWAWSARRSAGRERSPFAGGGRAAIRSFSPEAVAREAERLFKAASVRRFAPYVVFVGHRSRSVNNPHASALECGACGGTGGGWNAWALAEALNDPAVRAALSARGVAIPPETVFAAAEHETTTDGWAWLTAPPVSGPARKAHERLSAHLEAALSAARAGRARRQPVPDPEEAFRRAADFAEVRPEWGLAGHLGLVIGRRTLTAGADWGGTVFLLSYDWETDTTGAALQALLAGPGGVFRAIGWQYFLSTAAPGRFGGGDKTTLTVLGGIGVMQGNGSDLLPGLPWQSVALGEELVHRPLRPLVLIEAPPERVRAILAVDPEVRAPVEGGWLRLRVLDPRTGRWVTVSDGFGKMTGERGEASANVHAGGPDPAFGGERRS